MSYYAAPSVYQVIESLVTESVTASNEAINQRLFAFKKVFIDHPPPLVAIEHKLVLEKINIGSLVSVCG